MKDDIVPLALGEFQARSSVGLDGDEISRNDLHLVLVDAELEDTIDSRVHQAKAVFLALLNHSCQLYSSSGAVRVGSRVAAVVFVGSVYETAFQGRRLTVPGGKPASEDINVGPI